MSKKRRAPKLCYLCGKPGPDTDDHVPPRGIFPKVPQGNLITVPSHKACNNEFQGDDELFRNLIIQEGWPGKAGKVAWDQQVVPSFEKNPGARRDLLERLVHVWVKDPVSDALVRRQGIAIEAALYEREMGKITRGLFYHRFKRPLPRDLPIEVQKLQPAPVSIPKLRDSFARDSVALKWIQVEPGVFTYYHDKAEEDETIGFAILVFYDSVAFMTFHGRIQAHR